MYSHTANRLSLDPPPFLQSQYQFAHQRFEQELPLPGVSVKVPYKEQPARFLNLNRKKYELDYLRSQIQHKVEMEELHYQARLEQMRRENELNRYRLEQMLKEHPEKNLYAPPQEVADNHSDSIDNLSNISITELYKKKQKLYSDSIDKVKQNDKNSRVLSSARTNLKAKNKHRQTRSVIDEVDSDSSNDTEKRYKEKMKRQEEMDYIYKRREDPKSDKDKTKNFFSVDLKKKEDPDKMDEDKRREYEWVQKVRRAKGNPVFVVPEVQQSSDDSSVSSKSSSKSKSSVSKPSTKKENIFARREEDSNPSEIMESQNSRRVGPPRLMRKANPEVYNPTRERLVDRYKASENSGSRSSWRR